MNFDLPSFSGHPHFEDFLKWIMEVENFLEYMCIPENRMVKLVALKLKGGAFIWWEWLKLSQSREGKLPILAKMKWLLNARFLPPDDYGIQREPFQCSYGDQFVGGDVSHNHQVHHHLQNAPNRPIAYEENFKYGERYVEDVSQVELPSKKIYVQPQSLLPMTTSIEEQLPPPPPQLQPPPPQLQPHPPQMQPPLPPMQLTTFTIKGDDFCEENNEVEEDVHEETNKGIFMEIEEKEESCLGEVYLDFSKYIFAEEPRKHSPKENLRTSYFQEGETDVGWFLREPDLAKTSLLSGIPFDLGTTLTLEYLENSSLSKAPKPGERTREHEFHPGYYSLRYCSSGFCSPERTLFTLAFGHHTHSSITVHQGKASINVHLRKAFLPPFDSGITSKCNTRDCYFIMNLRNPRHSRLLIDLLTIGKNLLNGRR